MQPENPRTVEATRPAPEQVARWEDYIDVFFSPAELFRRRAGDSPRIPLVTLAIASILVYIVMLPANTALMRAAQAQAPQMGAFMDRWGGLFAVAGAIFAPIMMVVLVLFAALLLWGASRVLGVRLAFSRAVLIATFAAFVHLLGQIAAGIFVMVQSQVDPVRDTSFGILRFTGAAGFAPALLPLLRRVELFAIWQAILWAVGLRVIARATIGQAIGAATATWLLFAVPGTFLASLQSAPATMTSPTPPAG